MAARASTPAAPKVLHVEAGHSYGGSLRALETYLANVAPGEFSHEVLLYYPTPGREALLPHVSRLQVVHQGTSPAPGRAARWRKLLKRVVPPSLRERAAGWLGLLRSLPVSLRLARVFRAGRYDLIDVNNTFTYQPATLLGARIARLPAVCHVRNPLPDSLPSRLLLRLASRVVAVSPFHERQLRSWSPRVPVTTCHDCIEISASDPARAKRVREELLSDGRFLIGSVGRLDEQKGYTDLVGAVALLVATHPDVRLAIAGDGPLRPALERLIAELRIERYVQLCGFRSDVPDFLAALDVFASSSHWEGLPIAVVEAMFLKVPVVATDIGGNTEVVLPGRTGTLVAAGDPRAMAEGLRWALDHRDAARSYTPAARDLAVQQFDPALNARRLGDVFHAALNGRRFQSTSERSIAP